MKTINVGILGHVDSGKTSLCKIISSVGSTASFDKHPESKKRGMTIDLGFSMFSIEDLQVCLVDCPGHASLIKTIIGGSQIIDMMILVIDANKGIETQTAECIVISQILKKPVVVVFNKMDLFSKGEKYLNLLKKSLSKVSKRFVSLSAQNLDTSKFDELKEHILQIYKDSKNVKKRNTEDEFLYLYDHCFVIRGKGTVLTGTILRGKVSINDNLFVVPNFLESYKVKSIQQFRKPVNEAKAGDRVGILLSKFSKSKKNERNYATKKTDILKLGETIYFEVKLVKYYKSDLESRTKFHFTVGHETVVGTILFFDQNRNIVEKIEKKKSKKVKIYGIVNLEQPLIYYPGMICIGSKLDAPIFRDVCRLAFYGKISAMPENFDIFRIKEKIAVVDKIIDNFNILGRGIIKDKKGDLSFFVGKKIELGGIEGRIDGKFGKSGKFKVSFKSSIEHINPQKGMQLVMKYKQSVLIKNTSWIQ